MLDITKLQKWKENFIALSLALVIPFTCTSCNSKKGTEQSKETLATSQEEIITEDDYIKNIESEALKSDLLESENSSLSGYLDAIMSIPVMYNYEKYYITYKQVEKLIEVSEKETICNYEYSGDLDEEIKNLISQIEDNSIDFLKSHPEYERIIWQKKTPNLLHDDIDFVRLNFATILQSAFKSILTNATNDISEDICKFKDISIVMTKGIVNNSEKSYILGSYRPDLNIIYLNIDTIYQIIEDNKESDNVIIELSNNIKNTLIHELNHVRQQVCSCRLGQNSSYKEIGYQDNISFILESSAESALYNLKQDNFYYEKNEFDYTYYSEREKESLILLLGLLHDDMKVEDYYNAIFDCNLKDFYEYCGVKTEEEIYVLHKIWYALDGLFYRNDLPFKATKESSLTNKELQDIIGTSYYVDIFRLVLYHMVEYTSNNPDFTVEDNLIIFNIVKDLIATNIKKKEVIDEENIQYTYEDGTVNAINALEQLYNEFLSNYYQIEKDKLELLEEEYDISYDCCAAVSDLYIHTNLEIKYFLERYPILKYVLKFYFISGNEYEEFLEANSLSLNRKLN